MCWRQVCRITEQQLFPADRDRILSSTSFWTARAPRGSVQRPFRALEVRRPEQTEWLAVFNGACRSSLDVERASEDVPWQSLLRCGPSAWPFGPFVRALGRESSLVSARSGSLDSDSLSSCKAPAPRVTLTRCRGLFWAHRNAYHGPSCGDGLPGQKHGLAS